MTSAPSTNVNGLDTTYVTANSATHVRGFRCPGQRRGLTAYTGIKNAPTIAAGKTDGYKTDVFFYCKNGKMVTVMFVLPQSKVTIEDDNNKMIFFAKESGSDLEHDKDSNYFEYNAIVNGEIKTVKVDENATGLTASGANGLFKSFTTDKYGVVSGVKEYNAYGAGLKANPKTQPRRCQGVSGWCWYRQGLQGVHCYPEHHRRQAGGRYLCFYLHERDYLL